MKRYLLALLLPLLCLEGWAQEKLFNDALLHGRRTGEYYVLDNSKGKPLSSAKLTSFAKSKGYLVGNSSTKSISRFGDVAETVASMEFLPLNEYSAYVFENISGKKIKMEDLKATGSAYLYNANASGNNYFVRQDNIAWSGALDGSMLQGDGTGLIKGTDQLICFTAKFDKGMPQGAIEVKTYSLKSPGKYASSLEGLQYTKVGTFSEDIAWFEHNGKYGFVDRQGQTLIAPDYTAVVQSFKNGHAAVKKDGKEVWIDQNGTVYENELYSDYAKHYVEDHLKQWQAKDPYETVDEYKTRVTEETRKVKTKELLVDAEKSYIKKYTKGVDLGKSLKLRPYDAENQVFLVESDYGELIVPVPRDSDQARNFEAAWRQNGMKIANPEFYINDNKMLFSALTFITPSGATYQFSGGKDFNYTETNVDVKFEELDYSLFASNNDHGNSTRVNRQSKSVSVGKSDVDTDIPETDKKRERTFALIICNEDYDMVAPVPMALNDGHTFGTYCEKVLGLPHDNVTVCENATYGVMVRQLRHLSEIASAFQGDINVIFYYAGHGIPNESTKDAYLLPKDADGKQTEGCYSLKRLYSELGGLKANSVLVFLDACFSGSMRDGGMLASARGVALKSNKERPQGNMVVFSAASDDETAMPYADKGHGLFTYYLLKKLQETKGNVTLSELGNYIETQVRQRSTVVNHKLQTPTVMPSQSIADTWKNQTVGD